MTYTNVNYRFQVFLSYSHSDSNFQKQLVLHLAALQRTGVIELWHDRDITAGENWEHKIHENLEKADVVLLLISADFIASDYCYDIEMKRALELHKSKQVVVIPIIARNCDWTITPIGKLQALPSGGKPVIKWEQPDDAWTDIAQGIRHALDKLKPARESRPLSVRGFSVEKCRGIGDTLFQVPNGGGPEVEFEAASELLMDFFFRWPNWSFNLARIRGWGARQPGLEALEVCDPELIKKALRKMEKNGLITSYSTDASDGLMYKVKTS